MKTSTTTLFSAMSACVVSVALLAQDSTRQDNSAKTAPTVLPTVVVKADTSVEFTTDKDAAEKRAAALALKHYLFLSETDRALNRFTLPLFGRTPEQRALVRFREDQRLEQLSTLEDRIAYLRQTNPAAARRLRQETYALALRDDDMPRPLSLASLR